MASPQPPRRPPPPPPPPPAQGQLAFVAPVENAHFKVGHKVHIKIKVENMTLLTSHEKITLHLQKRIPMPDVNIKLGKFTAAHLQAGIHVKVEKSWLVSHQHVPFRIRASFTEGFVDSAGFHLKH